MAARLINEIDEENVVVIKMRDDGGLVRNTATEMEKTDGFKGYTRGRINKTYLVEYGA